MLLIESYVWHKSGEPNPIRTLAAAIQSIGKVITINKTPINVLPYEIGSWCHIPYAGIDLKTQKSALMAPYIFLKWIYCNILRLSL